MKSTDKKSRKNSSSDDTLIYVLLFLLVALLAGGLIYWKWPKTEPTYDYEKELGKWENSPTQKMVSELFSNNRNRIKAAERVLDDKVRKRKLTAKEKEEVRAELNKINKGLYKDLQGHDLKIIEKENPEMLATIYEKLYEDGKVLIRIKSKISADLPHEKAKKQLEFQKKWKKVFASEWQDMEPKISEWLKKWHHQARELIPKHGGRPLTRSFIPLKINGREADPNSREDINYFLDAKNEEGKKGWRENITFLSQLRQPPKIDFQGYGGFVDKKKLKESSEGSETFGLTTCNAESLGWGDNKSPTETSYIYLKEGCRWIVITLSKKLFLNRLGYEEWITDTKKENNNRTYYDICFEAAAETIIHELAHSIVDVMKFHYDGEEGGGHGKLFYDLMEDIEKIVKNSPEFEEFKTWWQKPEKENKEWAAATILGDGKKSHWDEWKYWYIGGGIGVLVIGLVVVVIFWDELTGSKKNVKN